MKTYPTWILCFLAFLPNFSVCAASQEVGAKPRDDVLLQCLGSRDADIKLIRWNRADLKSEDYVFYFIEKRSYDHYQHSAYKGRVELKDPEMKNGDFSVILKNVTINDTGIYECEAGYEGSTKSINIINTINLTVTDSGQEAGHSEGGGGKDGGDKGGGGKDGNVGLILVVLVVVAVLLVAGVVVLIYKKPWRASGQNSNPPPAEVYELQQLRTESVSVVVEQ